ncbi:MAG TPA: hypothetical protein DCY20_00585 [Firmicutes bacterium]|nr:hypothetical protein [Bacillota bacterium]
MDFKLDEEVKDFEKLFRGHFDAINADEDYYEDPNGAQKQAIIIENRLKDKELIKAVITFPDGGGYDVDFVYENDNAVPGITKDHFKSREELLQGWQRFISLYK